MISHARIQATVAGAMAAVAVPVIGLVIAGTASAGVDGTPSIEVGGSALEGATIGTAFTAGIDSPAADTASVKWFLDGKFIVKTTGGAPRVGVSVLPPGTHTLQARIYSSSGSQLRLSARWSESLVAPTSPPPVDTAGGGKGQPVPPSAPPVSGGRVVKVADSDALASALAWAQPGTIIDLADGTYVERQAYAISTACTAAAPCVLQGSRGAVIDGRGMGGHYGLHLTGAAYWTLRGFSVTDATKGIVLDGASHNVIDGVEVYGIGDEGIHLRAMSSDNVVRNSRVHDTGKKSPQYGEGIYVGSAKSNWATYSGGQPDTSDHNVVAGNTIFATGAEDVDIKEGTTGGTLSGNSFDGAGMSGKNFADSWVDVKGNDWTVTGNTGVNALLDGFQTHVQLPGWGQGNVFSHNVAHVNSSGYGFKLQSPLTSANAVSCDNVVDGAQAGMANLPCAP